MNVVLFKPCSADDLRKLVGHLNFSYVKNQENRLESLIQPNISQNDVAIELDQRSSGHTQLQLLNDDDSADDDMVSETRHIISESAIEANDTLPQSEMHF